MKKAKTEKKEKTETETGLLKLNYRDEQGQGLGLEAGLDEVGRGCLFGNVVTCACIMPHEYPESDVLHLQIRDSKRLSPKKRKILSDYILKTAIAIGIGSASEKEIDSLNIRNATQVAFHRAIDQVITSLKRTHPDRHLDFAIVDGDYFKPYILSGQEDQDDDESNEPNHWLPFATVEQGDDKYLSIAAASIVAKVYRDEQVLEIVERYPEFQEHYGLKSNKGYGTKAHMDGLKRFGATEFHRLSFKPCALAPAHQQASPIE